MDTRSKEILEALVAALDKMSDAQRELVIGFCNGVAAVAEAPKSA